MQVMDDVTRNEIAGGLEQLASQAMWNEELWQRCYDLVAANHDEALLAYIHDDLIHMRAARCFGPNRGPKTCDPSHRNSGTLRTRCGPGCRSKTSRSNIRGEMGHGARCWNFGSFVMTPHFCGVPGL